jgi:DNA-binding beta-propeller fold protein YncE
MRRVVPLAAVLIAWLGIVLLGAAGPFSLAASARIQLVAGNIEQPTVLALDPHGNVYVVVYGLCGLYDSILKLAPNGTIIRRFEFTYGSAPGQFKAIAGIAADAAGNMYVADFLNSRIQKLSPAGVPLAAWRGNGGNGTGISYPEAVTLDAHGNLYVLDSDAGRVLKLAPNGTVLSALSTGYNSGLGISPTDFLEDGFPNQLGLLVPSFLGGLAVDTARNIYVATGNDVRKLSQAGAPLAVWRPPITKQYVQAARQVAVDPEGNIYTSGDPTLRRQPKNGGFGVTEVLIGSSAVIDKLSPGGTLLARWGNFGRGPDQFREPIGLATDTAGDLYVADSANDRIDSFTASGTPRSIWGDTRTTPTPPGRFGDVAQPIAVGAHGRLLVATGIYRPGVLPVSIILQVASTGRTVARWKTSTHGAGQNVSGLGTDWQGDIYLADAADTGVIELSPGGRLLHHWFMPPYHNPFSGFPPSKLPKGLPKAPTVDSIAVAPWGRIYATADGSLWSVARSARTFRVLVHGSNGETISSSGRIAPHNDLGRVAVGGSERRIYAIDQDRRVDVFSPAGKQRGRRQPGEACAGIVSNPVAIAVGPRGTLYIADGDPVDQVLKFSPGGRLLARWGSRGEGPTQFRFFLGAGLAVGPRGNVFVRDLSGRIRKFSPAVRLLATYR